MLVNIFCDNNTFKSLKHKLNMDFTYDLDIYERPIHGRPKYSLRGWSCNVPVTKGEQIYIEDDGYLLALGEVESIIHTISSSRDHKDKVTTTSLRVNMLDPDSPIGSTLERCLKNNYGNDFKILG